MKKTAMKVYAVHFGEIIANEDGSAYGEKFWMEGMMYADKEDAIQRAREWKSNYMKTYPDAENIEDEVGNGYHLKLSMIDRHGSDGKMHTYIWTVKEYALVYDIK